MHFNITVNGIRILACTLWYHSGGKQEKIVNGIPNMISINAYHHMHKCNKSDKGSNPESKIHPLICNSAINAQSPQVWTHFQRLRLRMLIPRGWCLRLHPEKESHYQLHVLVGAEGTWELWCGCRLHAAQSHVRVPALFASGFTCNTCSIVRGFLCITSL